MPTAPQKKRDIPDGVWIKCTGCEETVFRKKVEEGLSVCPSCGYHFTLSALRRVESFVDEGTFEETDAKLEPADGLGFVDLKTYPDRLADYGERSGLPDAIVTGSAEVMGHAVALAVMEPNFMMASMGSVVGEKVTRSLELGLERELPVIHICASGGARMQEGVLSLMQLAKTSAAVARLHEAGGLYITILTNPTTAGVMASFASLGDFVLAEPRALIGFTGPRVIKETIRTELPEGFQKSEYLMEHGFCDMIVSRHDMKETVSRVLSLLLD